MGLGIMICFRLKVETLIIPFRLIPLFLCFNLVQSPKFSHATSHKLLEGKAMHGIAEIYRNIGDLPKAKEFCLQAKDILIKIESKLDLAKVLVEEALIAREMREHGYDDNFENAIALFTELNAPKQSRKSQEINELIGLSQLRNHLRIV
jgi:hypothetical protein